MTFVQGHAQPDNARQRVSTLDQLGELIPGTRIAKESEFVFCGYLED